MLPDFILFIWFISVFNLYNYLYWTFQVVLAVENLPANAGHIRDVDSILRSWRSSGGGPGNPLHYFCLENPMDQWAWRATVHRVTESWTWLKWLSMHISVTLFTALNYIFWSQVIKRWSQIHTYPFLSVLFTSPYQLLFATVLFPLCHSS